MSSRIAACAAAALSAAFVAAPVLADTSADGKTITFKELDKGSRFDYIDNAPRNKHDRRPVFSVGDQFALGNPLADSQGHAGELRVVCTATKKAPVSDTGFSKAGPFCTGGFVLRDGTLFVETTDVGGKVTTGAVVGGTGAYKDARGTFQSTQTRTGADDVVNLG